MDKSGLAKSEWAENGSDKPKLVFLDIDGTLTPPGGFEPPESALRAVRKAREKGHKIFLCTGRNFGKVKPLLKFGFDGGITSCGGYIYTNDEVLYDCPLAKDQRDRLLSLLTEQGVILSIEELVETYNDERAKIFLEQKDRGSHLLDMIKAVWVDLCPKPMSEYDGGPFYKIVFVCTDIDQISAAREEFSDELKFIVHDFSEPDCIFGEIISQRADKGSAVRRAADALGFDISDTIGFGDSKLDIEMTETVGTSVCMENGSPFLKERSDLICPSTDDNGIEWAFLRLGLI